MTEQNIFQEIEADLAQQKYEELWKKYGIWIVTIAIVIVAATAGYSAWHSWQTSKNQQSTQALFDLMDKAADSPDKKTDEQVNRLEQFAAKNPDATQAVFAQLEAALLASDDGNKDKADQLYGEVSKNTSTDAAFRQFADLMIVRSQLDSGDPVELQKRLDPLMAENAPWRFKAMEYGAFLALRTGDKEKARGLFEQLSQNAQVAKTQAARAADILHYLSE